MYTLASTLIFATATTASEWEGEAHTTRYWDCCKPSCSWPDKFASNPLAPGYSSVKSCSVDGQEGDPNAKNICSGGGDSSKPTVYSCPNNQPFTKDGIMYGFAAAGQALSQCCTCYELEFTDHCKQSCSYNGQLEGKRMIVQVTNHGGDLNTAHFDLQIPGGGLGIFNGCAGNEAPNGPPQFSELVAAWGQRYGGVSSADQCSGLPSELRAGCNWRFNDFLNSDNPAVKYRQVKCPKVLTDISGCRVSHEVDREPEIPDGPTPSPPNPTPTPPPADPTEKPTPAPQPTPAPGGADGKTTACVPKSWVTDSQLAGDLGYISTVSNPVISTSDLPDTCDTAMKRGYWMFSKFHTLRHKQDTCDFAGHAKYTYQTIDYPECVFKACVPKATATTSALEGAIGWIGTVTSPSVPLDYPSGCTSAQERATYAFSKFYSMRSCQDTCDFNGNAELTGLPEHTQCVYGGSPTRRMDELPARAPIPDFAPNENRVF